MAKLYVHVVKVRDEEFEIAGLSEDKNVWFRLPPEYRDLKLHATLSKKSVVRNTTGGIKPIDGYRKFQVKLEEDLKKEYFDECDNLSYKAIPLEEIIEADHAVPMANRSEEELYFIQRIKELERQLNLNDDRELPLHQVEKKFVLEKFDRKLNVIEWLSRFENECERNKIRDGSKRVEALRFFLISGSPNDWYQTNMKKIGLANWPEWKRSFLHVFGEKGWSMVRKAFNFKYLAGSLVDYALAKERLLLEVDPNSLEFSRVIMIAIGLPIEVQEEIDREEIVTIEMLLNELKKLEDAFSKKKRRENTFHKESLSYDQQNSQIPAKKTNALVKSKEVNTETKPRSNEVNTNKKPCSICEALGWPNRWHPISECRNKDKSKCNFTEQTENEIGSVMKTMTEN